MCNDSDDDCKVLILMDFCHPKFFEKHDFRESLNRSL